LRDPAKPGLAAYFDNAEMRDLRLDAEEFGRWRSEADNALAGARVQADAELHNWACFSAEQAAKVAVKALLHGLGRAPLGP